MRQIEKSKNVVNPWGNGNDVTQTPLEFETLMQNAKNIFYYKNLGTLLVCRDFLLI